MLKLGDLIWICVNSSQSGNQTMSTLPFLTGLMCDLIFLLVQCVTWFAKWQRRPFWSSGRLTFHTFYTFLWKENHFLWNWKFHIIKTRHFIWKEKCQIFLEKNKSIFDSSPTIHFVTAWELSLSLCPLRYMWLCCVDNCKYFLLVQKYT